MRLPHTTWHIPKNCQRSLPLSLFCSFYVLNVRYYFVSVAVFILLLWLRYPIYLHIVRIISLFVVFVGRWKFFSSLAAIDFAFGCAMYVLIYFICALIRYIVECDAYLEYAVRCYVFDK